MKDQKSTILITGTTSGIGRALLEHFARLGHLVISVNSHPDITLLVSFPTVRFVVLDITNEAQVLKLIEELKAADQLPSLFFLNAGINKRDIYENKFEFSTFRELMEVNLSGVFTFVAAANAMRLSGRTFLAVSSASILAPNPQHLGYYLSKWGIFKAFKFFQRSDPENCYKTIVLGPVSTRITRYYDGPKGFNKKIFDWLSTDAEKTASVLASFAHNKRSTLYFPLSSYLFFYLASWILKWVHVFHRARSLHMSPTNKT